MENIGDKKLKVMIFGNELSYDELSVIAPEVQGIISREDYKKTEMETLAKQ